MNRSWRMPIVGMTLLVAVVLAASTAAGQGPLMVLQVVALDAKGALQAADGVTAELWLGGQRLAGEQTDASGTLSVPASKAGVAYEIRLSKAGYVAAALTITYHADGGYFSVGPAVVGMAVTEKIAPGVCYTITLLPLGAAPAAGGRAMKLVIIDAVRQDAAGKSVPLAGAAIAISQAGRSVASGASGADGSYESPPLAAGDYTVRVSLAGYKDVATVMQMPGRAGGSVLALRRLAGAAPPAQGTLTVRVHERRAAGPPHPALGGAEVFVHQKGRLAASGLSNAQGTFRFSLSPGDYQATVRKAGYVPQTVSARVGTVLHYADVYLPKDSGAVVDQVAKLTVKVRMPPRLAPVSGARVQMRLLGGPWNDGITTGADGNIVFNVKPATVEVRVTKKNFATATATVTVPAGGISQLIILHPSGPR